MCFGEARDFRSKIPLFWLRASKHAFFCAVPETSIFIVVSSAHTGVVLAHVPETTIKKWFRAHEVTKRNRQKQKKKQIKNKDMFLGVVPEATVLIVVSGAHSGVVLAHVPEATIKIVVSGT